MKQFFTLFKVETKLQFGLQTLKEGFKGGTKGILKSLGYILVVVLLVGSLGFAYLSLLGLLFEPAYLVGMSDSLLAAIVLLAMLLTFIFGIIQCIGLYYNRDTEFLFSLPMSQRTAFAGKFAPILVSELLINALIILPGLIMYARFATVDLFFWVKGAVVILLSSSIPLALASIIAALIMSTTVFVKHKDKIVMTLGVIFFILYMLGVQYLSAGMTDMDDNAIAQLLLGGGLMKSITQAFPPALWAAQALVYSGSTGMGALLLYVGISLGSLFICLVVAGSSFIRISTNQGEAPKSEKALDLEKSTGKAKSPVLAMLRREWRSILRSPVYAMNSLIMVIVGPIMVFSIFLIPRGEVGDLLSFLSELAIPPEIMGYILLGLTGLMYFLAAMNPAAFSVFSREGKSIWLLQTLPMEPRKIVMIKLLFGIQISVIAVLPMGILLGAIGRIFSIGEIVLVVLCALVVGTPVVTGTMLLDLQKPNLNWTSEAAAIKRGRNVAIGSILLFLYLVPNAGIVYLILTLGWGMTAVWIALFGVNGLITAGIIYAMMKNASKMLSRMGDD